MAAVAALGGFLLAALAALAPAALGSDRPLLWAANAVLAGIALALVALGRLVPPQHVGFRLIALPGFLFLLVAAWAGVQCLPLGPPLAHPAWAYAPEGAGPGAIAVNPGQALWRLAQMLAVAAIFAASFLLGRRAGWAAGLIRTFQVSAFLYAVYGFLRLAAGSGKLLWFDAQPTWRLAGPFVGPNNAATYFGLAAICGFAFLLRAIRRTTEEAAERSGTYRIAAVVSALPGPIGRDLVLFAAPFLALLATASRGGILFTIVACLAMLLLQALRRTGAATTGGRFAMLAAVLVALVLLATILELAGSQLSVRLLLEGFDSELRLAVARTTLSAIADHWLTGAGLGSFPDLFMLYQNDVAHGDYVWDKAHNDYLEMALDLGIPAAAALLLALLILAGTVLRGTLARRRNSSYPMIAVGATVLVGLHSLVDFSLQIEAIAIIYAMLLGIGVAQSESSRA